MAKINGTDKFNTTLQEKTVDCQTWEDLFSMTIDIAKSETHCATLAWFKEIVEPFSIEKGYGIARFKPIPLTTKQDVYEVIAYFFDILSDPDLNWTDETKKEEIKKYLKNKYKYELSEDDMKIYERIWKTNQFRTNKENLYCVIFTDYNYKNSIEAQEQKSPNDSELHSLNHGIVIDIK